MLSYVQGRVRAATGEQVARISRDVWLPAPIAAEEATRWAALLTALPAGSVLSGRTAAALHGLWLAAGGDDVDVTVPVEGGPRPAAPRRRGVSAHRRRLGAGDRTERAGIPVTSLARTWLDLAGELVLPDLVAAGDSALRAAAEQVELAARVACCGPRRGVRLARRALPLLDPRSRSRPESHLRVALAAAGLPAPLVNEAVYGEHGDWLAEPDLAYPVARLAVEYQGADARRPGPDAA